MLCYKFPLVGFAVAIFFNNPLKIILHQVLLRNYIYKITTAIQCGDSCTTAKYFLIFAHSSHLFKTRSLDQEYIL